MKRLPILVRERSAIGLLLTGLIGLSGGCGREPHPHPVQLRTATIDSPAQEYQSMEFSRPAPPRVEPVVHSGIRYEQVMNALDLGYDQLNGYLAAYDDRSGERLWVLRIYGVAFDPEMEGDVQEVYFSTMELGPAGDRLIIENELQDRFEVHLADRTVVPLR